MLDFRLGNLSTIDGGFKKITAGIDDAKRRDRRQFVKPAPMNRRFGRQQSQPVTERGTVPDAEKALRLKFRTAAASFGS